MIPEFERQMAAYLGVRDRVEGGRTVTERSRRHRARRRGELPPYPFLSDHLYDNAQRQEDTGCLIWTRARNSRGYGVLKRNGRMVLAHRLSLELKLGRPIGPELVACHTCDNPPCIEPDHLFEGTTAENAWDREAKGRGKRPAPKIEAPVEPLGPIDASVLERGPDDPF